MKKQILSFALLMSAMFSINAQTDTNIYNTSGTITANRTVGLGSYNLDFDSGTLHINGANNRVGIGTGGPTVQLDVLTTNQILGEGYSSLAYFGLLRQGPTRSGLYLQHSNYSNDGTTSVGKGFRLLSMDSNVTMGFIEFNKKASANTTRAALVFGNNSIELMRINQDGKVRIGNGANDLTTPDGYKLFVEEGILTEKVKVAVKTTADWADYVFTPDYKLMPLKEVEQFTKENRHLPNVPSAEEMVKNGLNVAEMDAKLLEKIEELTLYMIEQQKQIEELKGQVKILQENNNSK
jgi:hypothetical protein